MERLHVKTTPTATRSSRSSREVLPAKTYDIDVRKYSWRALTVGYDPKIGLYDLLTLRYWGQNRCALINVGFLWSPPSYLPILLLPWSVNHRHHQSINQSFAIHRSGEIYTALLWSESTKQRNRSPLKSPTVYSYTYKPIIYMCDFTNPVCKYEVYIYLTSYIYFKYIYSCAMLVKPLDRR